MKTITLQSQYSTSFTMVPNTFFDNYMPDANGEFVKIYLFLLRCVSSCELSVSIPMLADKFNHTENDIMRALKYWVKSGLISLTFGGPDSPNNKDSNNNASETELTGILLIDPMCSQSSQPVSIQAVEPRVTLLQPEFQQSDSYVSNNAAPVILEHVAQRVSKPIYTSSQLKKFAKKEDLSQLLYIAEKYLGKTLTSTETNSIIYFYETLSFPSDLIEYLIEYCVSKEHKSMRYIEKVALSWADAGIDTVSSAKKEVNLYNKNTYSVMKAFGISNRDPGQREREYINKWNDVYCFSSDMIIEACNRTIQTTHQPSFEYADSILGKWKEKNITHLNELTSLDEQFVQARATKRLAAVPKTQSNNKFNNFPQRTYDYDALEKQLLSNNG